MTAREWAGLLVISLLGIVAIAWLSPLVAALPPWIPSSVFTAHPRLRGGNPAAPPLVPQGSVVNVFIAGGIITVACIALYFWWITRPLAIRYAPRRERDQ